MEHKNLASLRKERVMSIALGEGIKYGIASSGTVGVCTYLATKYSSFFSRSFSISAKASLPIMTGLFFFCIKTELTMNSANRFPEKWFD